jgi:hypothetical protein
MQGCWSNVSFSILFAKIESYVKMVQEQLRDPSFNKYDKELEVSSFWPLLYSFW